MTDTQWGPPLTGKSVRNVKTGMIGTFLRYGDINNPLESTAGWIRFKGHGTFAQYLCDLEVCE